MLSQLKYDTARANGAKSRGPVTPEGRARSSRNSLRHGLSGKAIVLPSETAGDFDRLRQSYLDDLQPSGQVETDLVETMAVARWRLRRLWAIESNLFSIELPRRAEHIDAEFDDLSDCHRLADVFQHNADTGKSLALLIRYEGSLNRSYDRAFKQLQLLQRARRNEPNAGPVPVPNPRILTPASPLRTPAPASPGVSQSMHEVQPSSGCLHDAGSRPPDGQFQRQPLHPD